VLLEVSTKPPIHNLIHEFLINMAFTLAYPNFKKSLKMAFGPLGVKSGDCGGYSKIVMPSSQRHYNTFLNA
jgi:hypothetical protein